MPRSRSSLRVLGFGAFVIAVLVVGVVIACTLPSRTFTAFYELGAALFIVGILFLELMAGNQGDSLVGRLVMIAAVFVGALLWPVMLVALWLLVYRKWREARANAPDAGTTRR